MSSRYFSSDIIFEILTRTELQTLGNCRQVSNEWNDMTYESGFTQRHSERSKTIHGYFMQRMNCGKHLSEFVSIDQNPSRVSDLSLSFLPSPVKIEACCNQGLLFCKSQEPQSVKNHGVYKYYVCKPSTKQWQILPNPKTKYFTERIAIMVMKLKPLHYKIVRFSRPKECKTSRDCNTKLRCEVFDSKVWSWKTVNEIKLPFYSFLDLNPARSASGVAHWLTHNDSLLKFDVDKENWSLTPLPTLLHKEYYEHKDLLEYEGRIALACVVDSWKNKEVDLWVLYKKGENEEWRKRGTFDIDAFPDAFYNSGIAVATSFDKVMFHKFQDNSCNVVQLESYTAGGRQIFPYQSDLEPSNLRGGGDDLCKPHSEFLKFAWLVVAPVVSFTVGFVLVYFII